MCSFEDKVMKNRNYFHWGMYVLLPDLWVVVHILISRHKISKNTLISDTSAWKRLTPSMDS